MMKFVAICEGTRYPIWAAGESEEEAKADLWERVHNFLVNANAPETSEMSRKIDKMEASIDELVAMANRSRGGLWVGLGVVSVISSLVGFIAHWFSKS